MPASVSTRARDADGDLLLNQLSTLPKTTGSAIRSINFAVIPPGAKMISDPIGLDGDVDVSKTLNVAEAIEVDIASASDAPAPPCPSSSIGTRRERLRSASM